MGHAAPGAAEMTRRTVEALERGDEQVGFLGHGPSP